MAYGSVPFKRPYANGMVWHSAQTCHCQRPDPNNVTLKIKIFPAFFRHAKCRIIGFDGSEVVSCCRSQSGKHPVRWSVSMYCMWLLRCCRNISTYSDVPFLFTSVMLSSAAFRWIVLLEHPELLCDGEPSEPCKYICPWLMFHAFFISEMWKKWVKSFFPSPPPHCLLNLQHPLFPAPSVFSCCSSLHMHFPASTIEINGIDSRGVNGFCCQGEEDAL